MATTTNYGWTTPDDTSLVKDGASAIRTLGTSVDTTTKNLNPETTLGDVSFRSSTSNVNTRLGIGSTGQVLTVASGVPAWSTISAGGMTLLSTTTLPSAASSITISSISQDYNNLFILIDGVTTASDTRFAIQPNATTAFYGIGFTDSVTTAIAINNGDMQLTGAADKLLNSTGANNAFAITITNYTSSTNYKPINWFAVYEKGDGTTIANTFSGGFASDTAISSLYIYTVGNMTTGTVRIYGVK